MSVPARVRSGQRRASSRGTPLEQRLGTAGGTKFVPANYKNDWALIRRIDDESGAEPAPVAAVPAASSTTAPCAPPTPARRGMSRDPEHQVCHAAHPPEPPARQNTILAKQSQPRLFSYLLTTLYYE